MPPEVVDLVEIRAADKIGKPRDVVVERDAQGHLVRAVLKRVKVLGTRSPNPPVGRSGLRRTRYSDAALVEAAKAYEGLKSYANHGPNRDPNAERGVEELLGFLENAKPEPNEGVFADYVVVPHHPFAERLVWLAQNRPEAIGLSHNARGAGHVQGDEFVVESVSGAKSADVVTDPATTVSLFESRESTMPPVATPNASPATPAPTATPAPASAPAPAPATTTSQVPVTVVESRPAAAPAQPAAAPQAGDDIVALVEARVMAKVSDQLKAKDAEIDKLRVQLAGRERKERVEALLLEQRLPAHAVTKVFREQLLEAKDDAAMQALIEDRKKIAWHQSPSAPPTTAGAGGPIETDEQFLESLRKGGR